MMSKLTYHNLRQHLNEQKRKNVTVSAYRIANDKLETVTIKHRSYIDGSTLFEFGDDVRDIDMFVHHDDVIIGWYLSENEAWEAYRDQINKWIDSELNNIPPVTFGDIRKREGVLFMIDYHNLDIKNFTYSHVCNTTYPYESTLNSRDQYNT